MFELRQERHSYVKVHLNDRKEFEFTDVWIDADTLVREDGFRLVRMGRVRPPIKEICFRYFKGELQFEFFGDRTHWSGTVTGTWEIVLSEVTRLDRGTIEEVAADIDAALRAWPPYPEEQDIPIGVNVFEVMPSGADYKSRFTLKFGQPLTLRQVPPSTRWRRQLVPHRVRGQEHKCEALVRDDGVQLVRIRTMRGPADDGPDTYHYRDADVSFDLTAERRLSVFATTDTWEVILDPPGARGFTPALRTQLGREKSGEVIRALEEAFYAWPLDADEPDTPVNRVVFVGEHSPS